MTRSISINRPMYEIRPEDKEVHKGKPVICITDGNMFKSAKEAAEFYGICYVGVANCCNGKLHTTRGKKFRYIADLTYNVNDIALLAAECAELKAKMAKYSVMEAEEEAKRKAEEKRLARIERLKQMRESQNDQCMAREAGLAKAKAKLAEIEAELNELNKGDVNYEL